MFRFGKVRLASQYSANQCDVVQEVFQMFVVHVRFHMWRTHISHVYMVLCHVSCVMSLKESSQLTSHSGKLQKHTGKYQAKALHRANSIPRPARSHFTDLLLDHQLKKLNRII